MSQRPRISLCMIVRDEEEALGPCLEANAPWVDEIVLVDTGSTDGTVAVAERFGARILHVPWPEHFAEARNHGLAVATGDWILVLDADETLDAEAGADLRRNAADPSLLCLSFERCDYFGEKRMSQASVVRAWRRREDIRYRYRIHEQVLPDIRRVADREGLRRGLCRGEIRHVGNAPDVLESRDKIERNRRLGELQLAETPDDPYVIFKLAELLRALPDTGERVRALLEHAVAVMEAMPDSKLQTLAFGGQLAAMLARELLNAGEADRAWRIATFGVERCTETPDLLSIRGHCALARGDGAAAEQAFAACRAHDGRVGVIVTADVTTGVGALAGLARAYVLQGRGDEAATTAAEAVAMDPDSELALRCWVEIEAGLGRGGPAFNRLGEIVTARPDWTPAWAVGGEMLAQAGAHADALKWLERAAALGRDDAGFHAVRGRCLLAVGRAEQAAAAFEEGLPATDCRAGLVAIHLLLHADPTATLDPADESLVAAARRALAAVRGTQGHPFQERLAGAGAWLDGADVRNEAFLRRLL